MCVCVLSRYNSHLNQQVDASDVHNMQWLVSSDHLKEALARLAEERFYAKLHSINIV